MSRSAFTFCKVYASAVSLRFCSGVSSVSEKWWLTRSDDICRRLSTSESKTFCLSRAVRGAAGVAGSLGGGSLAGAVSSKMSLTTPAILLRPRVSSIRGLRSSVAMPSLLSW